MRESAALLTPAASSHTAQYTSEMALEFEDPTLLRGVAADTVLKGGSAVFSSNVLGDAEVAAMHKTTEVVTSLDDFISRKCYFIREGHCLQ